MVEDCGMFREARVGSDVVAEVVAVRCFPACTRRMSTKGAEVRRERRCCRVERDVSDGMVRGMAGGC